MIRWVRSELRKTAALSFAGIFRALFGADDEEESGHEFAEDEGSAEEYRGPDSPVHTYVITPEAVALAE